MKTQFDLYIASCEKDGGIYQYRICRQENPKLIGFTPMDRPMYMTMANNKLYVLLRAPFDGCESGLAVCPMDADGRVQAPAEITSTKGEVACHLAVDEQTVYAVNYISGSVIQMPQKLIVHSGNSIHPQRQTAPHTHFVSPTPDGQYICVTDLGLDKIILYRKDMTVASQVDLPPGHGPRHLAFHQDGKHVFCANELASTVSVLEYQNGKMTCIETVSALPNDFVGQNTAAAIRCEGDKIYVSNRGHDSVSLLHFSEDHLTLRKTLPVQGNSPRDFLVYGDYIIAANELSHKVTVISESREELVGEIAVNSPISLLVRQ